MQRTMQVEHTDHDEPISRPVDTVEQLEGRWVPVPQLRENEIYDRTATGKAVVINTGDAL